MTTSDLIVQNIETKFISGILLKPTSIFFELIISGSHQRIPVSFNTIGFDLIRKKDPDLIEVKFHKCHNYLNIKIQIIGSSIHKEEIILNFVSPASIAEIKENILTKKIAFLGCARNCISSIEEAIDVISNIGSNFLDYKIYIAENNSTDGTLLKLKSLIQSYPIEVLSFDNLDIFMPLRTQRLSYCRNELLNVAISQDFDYICVADMDGVFSRSLEIQKFLSNWAYEKCWDACFPINEGIYYDLWAFRHPEILTEDFSIRINRADYLIGESNIMNIFVKPLQNMDFSQLKNWLEVDSAFGGMGIYKLNSLRNIKYCGYKDGREVCEHVELHRNMRLINQAKLYINPEFIIKGI